jgi:hypothetical protein
VVPAGAPAPSPASWPVVLAGVACAVGPASLAAAHVGNVADAAHDAGIAAAMGLEAGPWRALDAVVASAFAALPVGSLAARAAMGQALVVGAAGATLYVLGLRLASRAVASGAVATGAARWFAVLAPAVAALAAVCAPPWQLEGGAAAGSATGALLALLPLLVASGPDSPRIPRWRLTAFALGLALGHEPLVGACALASCVALAAAAPARLKRLNDARADAPALAACLAAGLLPLVLAVVRVRLSGAPLGQALTDLWAGETGASPPGSPSAFVRAELGPVLGALAVAGVVLAALGPRARPLGAGVLAVLVVGAASIAAGVPAGPTRFGAPVLAAAGAACVFAGLSMQTIVRVVAEARLPLSRASAAMVLLLMMAIPADAADESLVRALPRAGGAASVWDDAAWAELPPRAVVLATDLRLWRRAAAARATGSLRGDVVVVPAFPRGPSPARVLARDAQLVPLWRDLELAGMPTEESLSTLSTVRPLALAFEPRWGRVLGRHLVPATLLDRFEPEPRGPSDRKRALDAFAPRRERLARLTGKDPELTRAAAYLLRARVLGVAGSGDRELVGRVVEDLHAFAPDDPVATAVVARVVLGHGGMRLEDLRP